MSTLAVCVIGARGRMGTFARALLEDTPGFELAEALDVEDELAPALAASRAALGLDLTVAGRGSAHGKIFDRRIAASHRMPGHSARSPVTGILLALRTSLQSPCTGYTIASSPILCV